MNLKSAQITLYNLISASILTIICMGAITFVNAQERSMESNVAVNIEISNNSDVVVDVSWVNYEGEEIPYYKIFPEQVLMQETAYTHVWRFRVNGELIGTYIATAEPEQYYEIVNLVEDESTQTDLPGLESSEFNFDRLEAGLKMLPGGFTTPYVDQYIWTKKVVYDLTVSPKVTFEFDVLLTHPAQEIILAFSHNRQPYGVPEADGITIRLFAEEASIWFRSGVFANFLDAVQNVENAGAMLQFNQWQRYRIEMTPDDITVFIGRDQIGKLSLQGVPYPRKGHFGVIIWGKEEIAETTLSLQNLFIQGGVQAQPSASTQPEATQPQEITSQGSRGLEPIVTADNQSIRPGRYFAVLIAVQDYRHESLNDLNFPVQDAENVFKTLTQYYTFEAGNIIFLKNPSKAQITDTFDKLLDRVTQEDNLLIFYAGHGYWDERLEQGYWLPADARRDSRNEWLSNGTIRDYIKGMKNRHTLLISDACFSGGIFKTRSAFGNLDRATAELYKTPSRKAMTSGSLKEVPDKSVFVEYLIKKLQENSDKFISSHDLFAKIRVPVINNSPNAQVPQFGIVRETGDEDGEFIFIRR